jgi:hypothetical protein
MSDNEDDVIQKLGFKSYSEFYSMVSAVDMSTTDNVKAYKEWQHKDGTKAGLEKLPVKSTR